MKALFLYVLLSFCLFSNAQKVPFRFAFISDTHIGSPNGGAEEDLRRTVADINSRNDLDFVVITGDITELGKNTEIALAKKILDSLKIPYYIVPGNHDTGWSESGGLTFNRIFGDDKFYFTHKGIHFIACASGPYVRMSDGHIPRSNVNWLKEKLSKIGPAEPVVFLNHYPLDNGLDNWYEVIDLLKQKNTILALCGHGHSNRPVQAEEIPAVMGRSNLRAKAAEGGYNLVDVRTDSILFTERKPLTKAENQWTGVAVSLHQYDQTRKFPRPDFSINQKYTNAKARWTYSSAANVISTPALFNQLVVFGNQNGTIEALDRKTGQRKWTYQTDGPIFSSPAASGSKLVVGSADNNVYCLNEAGKLVWKYKTGASVLGCPVVEQNKVYIGGSDHSFRALDLNKGTVLWSYDSLKGPLVSTPVIRDSLLIFGAWDNNLYALNKHSGALVWKWNGSLPVINYSPAACIPVIKDDRVYVVAPDRFLSAIDLHSGQTVYRTKEGGLRESIGISEKGDLVYGKSMQDTVVAFRTGTDQPQLAWKMHVGFGYEHAPSMLVEKQGQLYFGTRNGIVYAIAPATQTISWAYKIDNSMVNTVKVLSPTELIASTMDGKVCLIESEDSATAASHQP
ncbi:MAG TPA: PQQ-binding-like beta-propeller repeat protein [Flavisolibacter sp.]|jgi:outer membrane protein assembly factor BamB/Icc-related predicted phosphoesterase|nr:PQQ-binding-like beta-propeller repeat protein [Flavisolibacter sp.]